VPQPTAQDDPITQAAYLARDIAPDLDVVLITHYPDVETLDTLRPGQTDLQTTLAVNRAVAREMLDAGVEVLVQRADRAALRRWMSGRDNTPENRLAWIDRSRLVRGSAALEVLGLKAPVSLRRETFGTAPGPIANRLLEAFGEAMRRPSNTPKPRRANSSVSPGGRSRGGLPLTRSSSTRRTAPNDSSAKASGDRQPCNRRNSSLSARAPDSINPRPSTSPSGTSPAGSATASATNSAHLEGPIGATSAGPAIPSSAHRRPHRPRAPVVCGLRGPGRRFARRP
jgi:hypothetical protein